MPDDIRENFNWDDDDPQFLHDIEDPGPYQHEIDNSDSSNRDFYAELVESESEPSVVYLLETKSRRVKIVCDLIREFEEDKQLGILRGEIAILFEGEWTTAQAFAQGMRSLLLALKPFKADAPKPRELIETISPKFREVLEKTDEDISATWGYKSFGGASSDFLANLQIKNLFDRTLIQLVRSRLKLAAMTTEKKMSDVEAARRRYRTFDLSAFKEAHPDLYEQFLIDKTQVYLKFSSNAECVVGQWNFECDGGYWGSDFGNEHLSRSNDTSQKDLRPENAPRATKVDLPEKIKVFESRADAVRAAKLLAKDRHVVASVKLVEDKYKVIVGKVVQDD